MYKDITDVMLSRAYAVDYMFQNVPFTPEAPKRHLFRKAVAWALRKSGQALTWTGDRVAV